jgi:hypothetical protein
VVGIKAGLYNGMIPILSLQVFNSSGARRSIWADVKYVMDDDSAGWEQTRPFLLRGDEREGFQIIKQLDHVGQATVTNINVLGCGS